MSIKLGSTSISKLYLGSTEIQKAFLGSTEVFTVNGGAWTPAKLSTELWLDASDSGTITESSGAVSQWADKSGNENNVSQANSSLQPLTNTNTLNSKNVIYFDGSDLMNATFEATLTQPNSVFAVFKRKNLDSFLFDGVNDINRHTFTFYLADSKYFSFAGSLLFGSVSDTNAHMMGSVYNSNSSEIFIDGTSDAKGDVGTQDMDGITLGGRYNGQQYYDGDIAEIIVVDDILSESDRQKLEGYLAHKWGLEGNLPALHPYKSSPPTV